MNHPLHGRRILVTRPVAQAGRLAEMIVAQGGEPVVFPLLAIGPADDPKPLQRVIARLDDYALAVFISPNAVEFSLPQILAQHPWPASVWAAAVGPSTANLLTAYGIAKVLVPGERFDSEALLELPALAAGQVAGKKVVILRGNGGRELLAETLAERGAQVDCVTCYHRSAPRDGEPVAARLRCRQLDALTISSSEGLRNLMALLDAGSARCVQNIPVFVPHQRIAEVAAALGLQRVILTRPADAGMIEGLCAYPWLSHE